MRAYESIMGSTLAISAEKVPDAFQALKKEIEEDKPSRTYEDLLSLLRGHFAWEGTIQTDGSITGLCPIMREGVSHEDWRDLLHLLADFLEAGTSIEFIDNDDTTGKPLRYYADARQVYLQQQIVTWQDCSL